MTQPLEIEPDKKYILFSKEQKEGLPTHLITEYVAYTDDIQSIEKLIIIFSKNQFTKPMMTYPEGENDYGKYPAQTTAKDFSKWLFRTTSLQENLQIDYINYKITKP